MENERLLIIKQLPKPENEPEYVKDVIDASGMHLGRNVIISTLFLREPFDLNDPYDWFAIAAEYGRRANVNFNFQKMIPKVVNLVAFGPILLMHQLV